jgi:hypothetical protein
MTISGNELRFLRRYRDGMKGKAFAKSMQTEQAERSGAYWRAAFPWIPCDSHGILWQGKPYKRMDNVGERVYADGTLLSERRRDWLASQKEADAALDRDAEIAALRATSIAEERAERTIKVRQQKSDSRSELRFK